MSAFESGTLPLASRASPPHTHPPAALGLSCLTPAMCPGKPHIPSSLVLATPLFPHCFQQKVQEACIWSAQAQPLFHLPLTLPPLGTRRRRESRAAYLRAHSGAWPHTGGCWAVDAGLMSLMSPGVFLGWWMVGTKILLSLSSKYVLFIVWFFGQL